MTAKKKISLDQKIEAIAEVCHQVNTAYSQFNGEVWNAPWGLSPEWQKESVRKGVRFHLENPDAEASWGHQEWLKYKAAEGWSHGPHKDPEHKQHPCFVPWNQLPKDQQAKDVLFKTIVNSLDRLL